MDADPVRLADYLRAKTGSLERGEQFWLGIAGAPGSGKSTLSASLLDQLRDIAIVIPMDGYHFYRRELDEMPDPEEAHKRRGAPFTFNAERFVRDLTSARPARHGLFPSFDHGTGDPIENDIHLTPSHKLVIVEGNYVLLDDDPAQNQSVSTHRKGGPADRSGRLAQSGRAVEEFRRFFAAESGRK